MAGFVAAVVVVGVALGALGSVDQPFDQDVLGLASSTRSPDSSMAAITSPGPDQSEFFPGASVSVVTPPPTPRATEPPVTYARLTANEWALIVEKPDGHVGWTYQLWACITHFDAATGADRFRAQASYQSQERWDVDGDDALFTAAGASFSDLAADDMVVMDVTLVGSFSQVTAAGTSTVPWFEVESIDRQGACEA